jgi:23S rRNA (uracil1939-C5)-methyltransferase
MSLGGDEQLRSKRARLAAALAFHRSLADIAIGDVEAAQPPLAYRTRVKWMAQGGRLGMYGRNGEHEVVDTPECRVAAPVLLEVAARLRARLGHVRLEAIDLREARDEAEARVLVTLVVADPRERASALDLARELMATSPAVAGVALNVRRSGPQVLGSDTTPLAGEVRVRERLGRSYSLATFGAFAQAHRGQAARLAQAIVERVSLQGSPPRVLELFAGSGAFGLELAAHGAHVTAIESFAPAARLIAEAGNAQDLTIAAHADDAEAFVTRAARESLRFDVILVDPPRRGLTAALRGAVASLSPALIAYVSCNPITLARDLAHFAWLGLRTARVQAFDMIPQTEEVESLAFLEPAKPPPLAVLARERDWAIVDKPPHLDPSGLTRSACDALDWPSATLVNPLPPAISGAQLFTRGSAAPGETVALVLAKGITRARGTLSGAHYRRIEVIAGHSLLLLEDAKVGRACAALARVGHPVLGSKQCDRPTLRHHYDKHGLDRAFCHVASIRVADRTIRAPLAGDLAAVVTSMGGDARAIDRSIA